MQLCIYTLQKRSNGNYNEAVEAAERRPISSALSIISGLSAHSSRRQEKKRLTPTSGSDHNGSEEAVYIYTCFIIRLPLGCCCCCCCCEVSSSSSRALSKESPFIAIENRLPPCLIGCGYDERDKHQDSKRGCITFLDCRIRYLMDEDLQCEYPYMYFDK